MHGTVQNGRDLMAYPVQMPRTCNVWARYTQLPVAAIRRKRLSRFRRPRGRTEPSAK